jgi:hypothetical protein
VKKHEFIICYVEPQCAYFKCNECEELVALDYPKEYADAEEIYNNLVRLHKHQ